MMRFPFTLRLMTLLACSLSGLHLGLLLLLWRPPVSPAPGQQIVYSSSIGQSANTYLLNPESSRYERLALEGQALTLAACSVDGERLAFVSGGRVHLVEVQGAGHWSAPLEAIPFRPVSLLAFNHDGLLVASRPGETWYFSPGAGGQLETGPGPLSPGVNLPLTPVERLRAYTLSRSQPPDSALLDLPPAAHTWDSAWSPDGGLLAYPTLVRGQAAIHLWDARARLSVQLTFMSGAEYRPTWSPDGLQLAFLTDQVSYADFYTAGLGKAAPNHLFSTREIYPYLCFLVGRPAQLLEDEVASTG
jgi:hypothetical protein